jgi:nucleotide-binding universal stress UspA family protein
MYTEGMMYMPSVTPASQRASAKKVARKALAEIEIAARVGGVPYASAILASDMPWEGILKTARAKRCDLIVMASHGRRGLSGLLLGSETTKVLTHSKIPVLVCR